MADIPHLAIPLRLSPAGAFAVNEDGDIDDVTQCVAVLLDTPVGSRLEVPEYGVGDLTFVMSRDGALETAGVETAVAEWEPRAEVDLESVVGVAGDRDDAETRAVILAGVRLT